MDTAKTQDRLTAREAARELHLTSKTIRRAIAEERLPASWERGPTGGRYMIAREDLDTYQQERMALAQGLMPAPVEEEEGDDVAALEEEITALRRHLDEATVLAQQHSARLAEAERTIAALRATEAAVQAQLHAQQEHHARAISALQSPPAPQEPPANAPEQRPRVRAPRLSHEAHEAVRAALVGLAFSAAGVVVFVVLSITLLAPVFSTVSSAFSGLKDQPQVTLRVCPAVPGTTCAAGEVDRVDRRHTPAEVQLVLLVAQAGWPHHVAIVRGRLVHGACHSGREALLAETAQTTLNTPQWQDAVTVHLTAPAHVGATTYCYGAMLDGHTVQMRRLVLH